MENYFREPDSFVQITPSTRQHIESAIERLVDLLNQIDGDPDLESTGDDEPLLGWPPLGPHQLSNVAGDDGSYEQDDSELEANGDNEPSLGWLNNNGAGISYSDRGDDRELDEHRDGFRGL